MKLLLFLYLNVLLSPNSFSHDCLPSQANQRTLISQTMTQTFINRTTAKLCAEEKGLQFLKEMKLSLEEALVISFSHGSETFLREINSALNSPDRFEKGELKRHLETAKIIESGLSKLPFHVGPVIRYDTRTKGAFLNARVGQVVEQKDFTSSSVSPHYEWENGDSDVKISINSKTGRNIMLLTPSRKEAEVIFLPGSKFKIDKVKNNTKGYLEINWTEL